VVAGDFTLRTALAGAGETSPLDSLLFLFGVVSSMILSALVLAITRSALAEGGVAKRSIFRFGDCEGG
jgi:hypothetical protein